MNLAASTLLNLWETGVAYAPAARPAALLAVSSGETLDATARLPLGRRDALLLQWFRENAGSRLEALADCPQCNGLVELEFDAADVERPAGPHEPVIAGDGDWSLSWRPPDTVDFCHAAGAVTADAARQVLLDRCLTVISGDGNRQVPEHLLSKLVALASDPQADVQLGLTCPACGATWQPPFDIGAFLWARIESEALRLLAEVHELAAAYSWGEAEILSLSIARRSVYLQLSRSA